ncbi:hypothetical protein [Brucella intermedia]|uniref:hypothetical protein n=1 Tax=Brucella intermedia TaxID=94625 RepID=UPI00124C42D7|nr:hypothetical protein [Brucella intermedia]KAB2716644.1 hypothetical protein F9K75_11140 [Brucella intermedia]
MFESEKIWTAVLFGLTVSYTAYCIFIFGFLLGSEVSTLDALLKFADTYGTIITGVPVLVAVVVAKQQMDASRRQHVATVKRSLKKELETLTSVEQLAKHVASTSYYEGAKLGFKDGRSQYYYWTLPDDVKDSIRTLFNKNFGVQFDKLEKQLEKLSFSEFYPNSSPDDIDKAFNESQILAGRVCRLVERERNHLSQYWS